MKIEKGIDRAIFSIFNFSFSIYLPLIARHTRSGVAGICMCLTPKGDTASITAVSISDGFPRMLTVNETDDLAVLRSGRGKLGA